ncbi:MAG: hypothetical protein CVU22_06990 [Betaproteobacteria bacterium HGW-Betaproteobacteria-16]|nr:MAG: hypothetical protein CVU22_06990 [Betaproteobacteria bacterium HGW-Betaproteobacteria-16]
MARKMIDANMALFTTLGAAVGDLVPEDICRQKRSIQTDAEEKEWLKNLSFRSSPHLVLGPLSKFVLGSFKNDIYLIAIGIDIPSPPDDLQAVPVNAGMFTAVVSELNVPLASIPDLPQQLREYVFYPVEEGKTELLAMDVVRPYFENFSVFKIDPSSALALDAAHGLRAAIVATLSSPRSVPLAWPQAFRDRIGYMARDPKEHAPFHLLLRALTEARGETAFLAVYRCIEQLFPIPAIQELSTALGISSPPLQVAAEIESHLGWRRREDDALDHLFTNIDALLIDRIRVLSGADISAENPSRPVARRVYELRNQCVHYRPLHRNENTPPYETWLELCEPLLEVVQTLYATYTAAFSLPAPATPAPQN